MGQPALGIGAACLAILLCSCGGGSSVSNPPPPPPADFLISVTPTSAIVPPGGALFAQVIVTGTNGFSKPVTINVSGLPTGSTVTPSAPFSMSPGTQNLGINVPANAPLGTSTISVQGSSGALQHSSTLQLQVQAQQLANFSVVLNNNLLSFAQGGSANTIVGISLTSNGNSNFQVQFSVTGLPAGVQASFGANPFDATQPATSLTFHASAASGLANYQPVTVTATRNLDGAQASAQVNINVTPAVWTLPPIRTDFIRTDGTPASAVFDATHNLVFATNPQWNRVDVISASAHRIVNSISAPTPTGIDISVDGKHVIVGSNVQQVVQIDTSSLQVSSRTNVPAPTVASASAIPTLIANMANGTVLLGMTNNSAPPSYSLEQWDPNAGTFLNLSPPGIGPWINNLVRTGDGQKALVVDYGTAVNMAVFDSGTNRCYPQADNPPSDRFSELLEVRLHNNLQ